MAIEDRMTIDERRKYLHLMQKRYLQADRGEQGRLLDAMQVMTKLHRKALIRLMNRSLERQPRRRQRGSVYGPDVDDALRVIAESMDYICAERLTPNLPWLARHLAAHGEMDASSALLYQLERISVRTVSRILDRIQQDQPRLPRKKPRQPNAALRDVPMRRIPWDEHEPGHFEVDLVHHCGFSASGEYMCTLQMVDVATGWSECVAVLGRSYLVIQDGFSRILARLPFPVLEVHPDNDSAFFNNHLLRFWKGLAQGVRLSRSRPYQKNDNRIVEQKNSTLVRALLGFDRFDTTAQLLVANQLYDRIWLYYNLFQPVMRLAEKSFSPEASQPTRVKRRYDRASTPFDRLCATAAISQERREQLQALRDRTNPRQLRQEIQDLMDHLLSLPDATPGFTEDVRLTLLATSSSCERVEHSEQGVPLCPPLPRKEATSPVTLSFGRATPLR
jgi:hypothetical protein